LGINHCSRLHCASTKIFHIFSHTHTRIQYHTASSTFTLYSHRVLATFYCTDHYTVSVKAHNGRDAECECVESLVLIENGSVVWTCEFCMCDPVGGHARVLSGHSVRILDAKLLQLTWSLVDTSTYVTRAAYAWPHSLHFSYSYVVFQHQHAPVQHKVAIPYLTYFPCLPLTLQKCSRFSSLLVLHKPH